MQDNCPHRSRYRMQSHIDGATTNLGRLTLSQTRVTEDRPCDGRGEDDSDFARYVFLDTARHFYSSRFSTGSYHAPFAPDLRFAPTYSIHAATLQPHLRKSGSPSPSYRRHHPPARSSTSLHLGCVRSYVSIMTARILAEYENWCAGRNATRMPAASPTPLSPSETRGEANGETVLFTFCQCDCDRVFRCRRRRVRLLSVLELRMLAPLFCPRTEHACRSNARCFTNIQALKPSTFCPPEF